MTKLSYGTLIEDSFKSMKENFFSLFLVFVGFQIIISILGLPFIYVQLVGTDLASLDAPTITLLITAGSIIFLVSAFFNMIATGMVLHIVEKKKVSVKIGFEYAKKYFWKYLLTMGLILIVMTILVIPLLLSLGLAIYSIESFASNPAFGLIGILIGSVLTIASVIIIVAFVASQLFVLPKTIIEEKNPYQIVKNSVSYLLSEPRHVLYTGGIVLLFILGIAIISAIFDLPFSLSEISISNIQFQAPLTIVLFACANIVKTVIQIILAIFISLFTASSYAAGFKKEVDEFRWLK